MKNRFPCEPILQANPSTLKKFIEQDPKSDILNQITIVAKIEPQSYYF